MIIVDHIEISPIKIYDAWKLCNFANINEDGLRRYFPKTLEQSLTPVLAEIFVELKVNAFRNNEEYLFTLKHVENRDFLGLVYIKELDWTIKQGEFAYCIDYNFEGKGVATKAVKKLSDHAFENLGLETLQIIVNKENIPSIRVAEKANFKWKKTLKNEFTPTGESPLDMELYEKYNER